MVAIAPFALSTPAEISMTLVSILCCFAYAGEATSPAPYSKFAKGIPKKVNIGRARTYAHTHTNAKCALTLAQFEVPTRVGMFIIYTPALLYSASSIYFTTATLDPTMSFRPIFLFSLLFLHFLKRVLECAYVHKYSGSMDAAMSLFIGLYYTFVSYEICACHMSKVPSDILSSIHLYLGLCLYAVGEAGNLYHHLLLASLRTTKKPSAQYTYTVPKGGFFQFVATPHYFFELVAWCGLAVVAQQANAYLCFVAMVSYLAGRSVSCDRWNRTNIPLYPQHRKNLVPGLW